VSIIILMTDADRNMRTLIVCFTLALMGLIPLRFVEVGQSRMGERPMVLGESVVVESVELRSPAVLEAPFDEIDGPSLEEATIDCLSGDEASQMVDEMTRSLLKGDYDETEISQILDEVDEIEARICQ
jgi:hypothetical protein